MITARQEIDGPTYRAQLIAEGRLVPREARRVTDAANFVAGKLARGWGSLPGVRLDWWGKLEARREIHRFRRFGSAGNDLAEAREMWEWHAAIYGITTFGDW